MDAYRTSNLGYIRQSQAQRADEYVPNLTEERMQYEQNQVRIIQIMKILLVVVLLLLLPLCYNLFRFGGLTNACGERKGIVSSLLSPVRWIFGSSADDGCQKNVSRDVKTDDKYKTETTTETTTCSRGGNYGERPVGGAASESDQYNLEALKHYYPPQENYLNEQPEKGGSFWDWFSGPAKGASECSDHLKKVEQTAPSVSFFKNLMPSMDDVLRNGAKYAKLVGGISALQPVTEGDVGEVQSLFQLILDPSRVWRTAEDSVLGAITRKPKEWLANIKNWFPIHSMATNLKQSGENLAKKKGYVESLKGKLDGIPHNSRQCVDRLAGIDSQINGLNIKIADLLTEKGSIESQIQDNQLKLNAFVSQRNSKEQEPINTVRQLDLELQELKFKLGSVPGIRADIDARLKAINKAEADILDLRRKLDLDGQSTTDIQSKIYNAQGEVDGLKRDMEKLRINLGLRRMKLQLANSNRQIKEHLMGLIRTNNGEAVDFQVLFSSSENARREIKRILRDFINQSAGMSYEINVTEEQIEEIISKDQKEFDEIRKIYVELVDIIKRYGDFNIYISGLAKDIKDLEDKLRNDDSKLNNLQHKIREWKALIDGTEARRAGWGNEIIRLETFIADGRRYIDDKEFEIRRWQTDYDKAKERKDIFMLEHKVW